jgi:hypothetical protein
MNISNVRHEAGRSLIARFDLEVDGIRVYDMELRRNGDGHLRVYAASPGSKRIVTFDRTVAEAIITEAQRALGGPSTNAQSSH